MTKTLLDTVEKIRGSKTRIWNMHKAWNFLDVSELNHDKSNRVYSTKQIFTFKKGNQFLPLHFSWTRILKSWVQISESDPVIRLTSSGSETSLLNRYVNGEMKVYLETLRTVRMLRPVKMEIIFKPVQNCVLNVLQTFSFNFYTFPSTFHLAEADGNLFWKKKNKNHGYNAEGFFFAQSFTRELFLAPSVTAVQPFEWIQ